MEKEIWKKIKGYPRYEVSNLGRVRNTRNGKIRVPFVNNCGYYQVNLCLKKDENGKTLVDENGKKTQYVPLISRLVAEAFIPNPKNLPEVNHIDEDKSHNYVSNLEWVTERDNVNHGTRTQRQKIYCSNPSDTHRANMSLAALKRGNNNNGARMVDLISKDGEIKTFDNVRSAARFLEANPSLLHYNNDREYYIKGWRIHKLSDDEMRERLGLNKN